MGSHPLNLVLRFLLELSALTSLGIWGWKQDEGWLRFILAFGIPIILAVIWGSFAVPNDPSRSGNTLVVTPGIVRLIIELGIFAFAVWALYDMGNIRLCWTLAIIVALHYIVSYDRIIWLLSNN